MPGTVVFSWDCRIGCRPDFVAEQSDNLVGVYKIVASDIADSVAVTVSGGAGERKSRGEASGRGGFDGGLRQEQPGAPEKLVGDRKSTRLNSSHHRISYAVFCLKKKKRKGAERKSQPEQPTHRTADTASERT